MGGFGSGRNRQRRDTVDDSLTLSMKDLRRLGFLHGRRSGVVCWNWGDALLARIGVESVMDRRRAYIRLSYAAADRGGRKRSFDYLVQLDGDSCRFGGQQWYFRCPACDRRVRLLHLPEGGDVFACRHCYDLTYESAQTHDARYPSLRRGVSALAHWMTNSRADARAGAPRP